MIKYFLTVAVAVTLLMSCNLPTGWDLRNTIEDILEEDDG